MELAQILAFVLQSGDGVVVVDHNDEVIAWNHAAEDILGYKADEVIGRPCFSLFQGVDRYDNSVCFPGCSIITCAQQGGTIRHFELSVVGKSGERKWVDVSIIPYRDSDGRLLAMVHLLRVTSAPGRLERLIENALARADVTDSDSAASVSVDPMQKLTSRQREIVELLAQGASTDLIATRLVITHKTVRNHVERILSKLGVHSRIEAIALASTFSSIQRPQLNGGRANVTGTDVTSDSHDSSRWVRRMSRVETSAASLPVQRPAYFVKHHGRKGLLNFRDLEGAIINGQAKTTEALTRAALEAGVTPMDIVTGALVPGMHEVGERFKREEYYVPEMLLSARAMKTAMALIRPPVGTEDGDVNKKPRVVIGTVQGDLHDIGKNLVAMMLEGAGFEVLDLGANVRVERFVRAAVEKEARLIALSALLTTTMTNMSAVIEALNQANLRERVKVIVGGAPVNERFAKQIGADAFAPDAASVVEVVQNLLKERA